MVVVVLFKSSHFAWVLIFFVLPLQEIFFLPETLEIIIAESGGGSSAADDISDFGGVEVALGRGIVFIKLRVDPKGFLADYFILHFYFIGKVKPLLLITITKVCKNINMQTYEENGFSWVYKCHAPAIIF